MWLQSVNIFLVISISGVTKGGNWEHAPRGAGPGGALTHFIQPFKNAFYVEI